MNHITYFEKIFLFMGIGLFVVLIAGMIFYIVKGKEIKSFFLFFLIPIIMVGYPSIQEIKYDGLIVSLKEKQRELIQNPTDSILKEEVATITDKVIPRARSSRDYTHISLSKILLNQGREAEVFANKALQKEPTSPEAKDLKQVAKIQQELEQAVNGDTAPANTSPTGSGTTSGTNIDASVTGTSDANNLPVTTRPTASSTLSNYPVTMATVDSAAIRKLQQVQLSPQYSQLKPYIQKTTLDRTTIQKISTSKTNN